MGIINYADEVSYRFTTFFFQLIGHGRKTHIAVLDSFPPLNLASTGKVGSLLLEPQIYLLCLRYWSSDLPSILNP